jgi:vitamin B12 transporter
LEEETLKKMRMMIVICLFCSTLMLFHFPCLAADAAKTAETTYDLGEIVVTGEKGGIESVGSVQIVTAEEIQQKGATNLNEAIELLPGLVVKTGGDGTPRVEIRGFRSRHVLLLLDGVPLNSTFDGNFNPTAIPVENIAKIKVTYSNHSVLYGDGALAGIINIITKKGQQGLAIKGSAEGGSGDSYHTRGSISGGNNKINFFLSGSLAGRDNFPLSDNFHPAPKEAGSNRDNSDMMQRNVFGNIGYTPNDKLSLGLIYNSLEGNYGKPPSTADNKTDPFASRTKYERMDYYHTQSVNLSGSYKVTEAFGVRGWVFLNNELENENDYNDGTYSLFGLQNTFHQKSESNSLGTGLQFRYDFKSAGALTLGLNGRQDSWVADGIIFDQKLGGGKWGGRRFRDDRASDIYSAALEYEFSPFKDVLVTAGYSQNSFNAENTDNISIGAFMGGIHYDIWSGTRLKGSVAKNVRFPSISQLYDISKGNRYLRPETAYSYEAGIEQRLPWKTDVSLTGFFIDMGNYIEVDDATGINKNNSKYRYEGIEVFATNRMVKNLTIRVGYTYMDTEDRSPGSQKSVIQYEPRHKFTLEGKYDFSFGLMAFVSFRYLADQSYYTSNAPILKNELRNISVVDCKVEQKLLKDKLSLYMRVNNLLDYNYEESHGIPQAGRTIFGGVTINFN